MTPTTVLEIGRGALEAGLMVAAPMLGAALFAAPTAYQGGYFSCVIAFGDENANGVKDVTQVGGVRGTWASFNPMAVQDYDATEPGFDVEIGVVGGLYDKAKNLCHHRAIL